MMPSCRRSLILAGASALAAAGAAAQAPTPEQIATSRPAVTLHTEHHALVRQPLLHIGYSFPEAEEFMGRMEATGANSVLTNFMWIPTKDPSAPDGLGISPPVPGKVLAQGFRASEPFDGFAPSLPTRQSSTSGCAWRLRAWADGEPGAEIAAGTFTNVADNSFPEATFAPQPPGDYVFEIAEPKGSWIGWWLANGDLDPMGQALESGRALHEGDFVHRLRVGGEWIDRVFVEHGTAIELGPNQVEMIHAHGMKVGAAVGNWNNPGFTYYPDWFFDVVPEAAVVGADGVTLDLPTMFERTINVPNISTAQIAEGTARFITATVEHLAGHPALMYWVMGGEALYATYSMKGLWTDYSDNEIAHYRAWLGSVRYSSLEELNRAHGTSHASFAEVDPPRSPSTSRAWLDWMTFRLDAMGERKAWHWQAVRESDWDLPAFSCNHGTLFHGESFAAMGADFQRFATNTDGFETGQIIRGTDPDYYNLLYIDSIIGLGKPYAPARLAYVDPDPTARGGGKSFTPDAVWRHGLETLASGALHLGFIEYEGTLPDGEWQIMDTPGEQATIDFFAFAKAVGPRLANMHPMKPRVGVWLPEDEWLLDGFAPEWLELHRELLRRHVPKVFVFDQQMRHRLAGGHEVLVVPGADKVDSAALRGLMYSAVGGQQIGWIGEQPDAAALGLLTTGAPTVKLLPDLKPAELARNIAAQFSIARMASRNEVRSPLTVAHMASKDIAPTDVASAREIGQSFLVEHGGLRRVSLRMPTYTKVAEDGFRFVLRRGGPDGEILQEGDVPGPIMDNAWVPIPVSVPVDAGETLYLGVSVPEGHPEETLGWWGSTSDIHAGGTAFVDGQPVDGDHEMELDYERVLPAEEAVLAFPMTDGLSGALVLVNTSMDEARLTVELDRLVARLPLRENLTLTRLPDGPGPVPLERRVDIDIAPSNGAILLVEPVLDDETATALREAAEARLATWEKANALTDYLRHAREEATRQREAGNVAKAAAMDAAVVGGLGLAIEGGGGGSEVARGDTLTIRVLDANGDAITPKRLWVEVTPSQGNVVELFKPAEDGSFKLALDEKLLPPRYDYRAREYKPFWGPARLRVAAENEGLEASQLVDVVVKR